MEVSPVLRQPPLHKACITVWTQVPQLIERPQASVHVTTNVPRDAVSPSCAIAQRRSVLASSTAELLITPATRIMCSDPNAMKAGAPVTAVTPQASPHTSAMSCLIQ